MTTVNASKCVTKWIISDNERRALVSVSLRTGLRDEISLDCRSSRSRQCKVGFHLSLTRWNIIDITRTVVDLQSVKLLKYVDRGYSPLSVWLTNNLPTQAPGVKDRPDRSCWQDVVKRLLNHALSYPVLSQVSVYVSVFSPRSGYFCVFCMFSIGCSGLVVSTCSASDCLNKTVVS